jgi:hypothetical protein
MFYSYFTMHLYILTLQTPGFGTFTTQLPEYFLSQDRNGQF